MAVEDAADENLTKLLEGQVSEAAARFLRGQLELLGWLAYLMYVAQRLDEGVKIARDALRKADGEDPDSEEEAEKGGAVDTLRSWAQLMQEMVLCRTVDNYLAYLSEQLASVFRNRPETLKSAEQVPLESVLRHESMGDLVDYLAERRVDRLSYSGISDLDEYLRDNLGFELFESAEDRADVVLAVERRNVIVHKRGVADARYLEKAGDDDAQRGERIKLSADIAVGTMNVLTRLVRETDDRAASKWGLDQGVDTDSIRLDRGNPGVTDPAPSESQGSDETPDDRD